MYFDSIIAGFGGQGVNRVKITTASLIGLLMGLLMIGMGFYAALISEEYGGFYVVVLGAVFMAAVVWGSVRKR